MKQMKEVQVALDTVLIFYMLPPCLCTTILCTTCCLVACITAAAVQ